MITFWTFPTRNGLQPKIRTFGIVTITRLRSQTVHSQLGWANDGLKMASVMWKSDSPNGNNRSPQNHCQITIEKHDKHHQNQQKSSFSKVVRILSPFISTLNHFAVPKIIHHPKHWATSFSCRRLPLQTKQQPNLLFEEKLTVDHEFFDKYDPIWGKHHCIHPQEVVNWFDQIFFLKASVVFVASTMAILTLSVLQLRVEIGRKKS